MSGIFEATEPTPKNLARVREAFEHLPNSELAACASAQPDTAKGFMANTILAERRAARAEKETSLATDRHAALLRAIATPHWSQTPGFWVSLIAALSGLGAAWYGYLAVEQGRQSSAQAQQAAPKLPSVAQISASLPLPSASSPPLQSSPPKK